MLISKEDIFFIRHLMVIECEYCKNRFKKKSVLEKHQRNAQYCLKLQGKSSSQSSLEKDTVFRCSGCPKTFTRSFNLRRHETTCPGIKYTVSKSENSSEVKSDRNVILQGIGTITEEIIQKHLGHLSLSYIVDGGRGFANYANVYPFNGRVVCTDYSRKKLRYKIDDVIVNDTGSALTRHFFQAIIDKSKQVITKEYESIQEKVQQISNKNYLGNESLGELLKRSEELQNTLVMCEQAAKGQTNELTVEFIKHFSRLV